MLCIRILQRNRTNRRYVYMYVCVCIYIIYNTYIIIYIKYINIGIPIYLLPVGDI